ncbi:MAG: chromate transporter [Bacteroidaceae bacterium]|nr:chromate transporter [Bacteroidaceae bacterium]
MTFVSLFWVFFCIGLFGFGGGYAMISLIQNEVVKNHHWLTSNQFTDIVAISQMTPGPIGINSATYVGYSVGYSVVEAGSWLAPVCGVLGSMVATIATVLPSFAIMLLLSKLILKYKDSAIITGMFGGLRPAIVGLLAAAAVLLINTENFGSTDYPWQMIISYALFSFAFVGTLFLKINPIKMIIICGAIGWLLYI